MAIGPAGSKGGCRRTVQKVCLMVCRRHEKTFGHVKSPQALPSGVFILGVFIPKRSSRYPRKTLAATFFSVQYILLLNPVIHTQLHINILVGRVLLTVSVGHRLASLHPPSRLLLHGHSQRIQYSSANPKTSSSPLLLFSSSILLGSSRKCRCTFDALPAPPLELLFSP